MALAAVACSQTRRLTQSEAEQIIRTHLQPFTVDSFADTTLRSAEAPYPVVILSTTLAAHDDVGQYTLPHAEFYFRFDKVTGSYELDPSFSGAKSSLCDMRARHATPSLPRQQKKAVDRWAIH